jgi:hypothetical protein
MNVVTCEHFGAKPAVRIHQGPGFMKSVDIRQAKASLSVLARAIAWAQHQVGGSSGGEQSYAKIIIETDH